MLKKKGENCSEVLSVRVQNPTTQYILVSSEHLESTDFTHVSKGGFTQSISYKSIKQF